MDPQKIINELIATEDWDDINSKLGVRADFKCEYCGKDLLASVENYKEWQKDHLIPQSAGGSDDMDNLVLTCKTCNFIKGRWNPLTYCETDKPTRDILLNSSKKYITSRKEFTQVQLLKYRKIIGRD